jgi:hypothetical protein
MQRLEVSGAVYIYVCVCVCVIRRLKVNLLKLIQSDNATRSVKSEIINSKYKYINDVHET